MLCDHIRPNVCRPRRCAQQRLSVSAPSFRPNKTKQKGNETVKKEKGKEKEKGKNEVKFILNKKRL